MPTSPGRRELIHADARLPPEIEIALLCVTIDVLELRRGEPELLERVERVVKLRDVARADERGGDAFVAQHPGDRHLRESLAAAFCDLIEGAHALDVLVAQEFLEEG